MMAGDDIFEVFVLFATIFAKYVYICAIVSYKRKYTVK